MKIYKPEDAQKTVCPIMSTVSDKCCLAEKCHFWTKVIKIGYHHKEVIGCLEEYLERNLIEKEYVCGYCSIGRIYGRK